MSISAHFIVLLVHNKMNGVHIFLPSAKYYRRFRALLLRVTYSVQCTVYSVQCTVYIKLKLTLEQTTKARRDSRDVALLFL